MLERLAGRTTERHDPLFVALPNDGDVALVQMKLFEPKEGMLILFPSYFFHRTVPTGSQDLRVSIAFDVMRQG